MSKRKDQRFQSPDFHYKTRQFSTADKYSNVELTLEKFNELFHENQILKECLAKQGIDPTQQISQRMSHQHRSRRTITVSGGNQVMKWDLEQKNQYLQKKVEKLKLEKARQSQAIQKIKNSTKWQTRGQCGPVACYKDKYLKLLRYRCPSTQF